MKGLTFGGNTGPIENNKNKKPKYFELKEIIYPKI